MTATQAALMQRAERLAADALWHRHASKAAWEANGELPAVRALCERYDRAAEELEAECYRVYKLAGGQ